MVNSSTYLKDTILFIRNDLRTNITDPISSTRPAKQSFVMTSYPQKAVRYPLITVKDINSSDIQRLGMQSELHYIKIELEVRVWARDIQERDELTEDVLNRMRSNQFGSGSANEDNLHDFLILSTLNIDEPGDQGIHSKIMTIQFTFVLGA